MSLTLLRGLCQFRATTMAKFMQQNLHHLQIVNANINRNYWRRSIFSELSSALQTVENRMRDMDQEMNKFLGECNRSSPVKVPRFFSPSYGARAREIPVVLEKDGKRIYRLEIEVDSAEPENITINLKRRVLSITAHLEEKKPDGSSISKDSTYCYTIPEEIDINTIKSSLSDGVLTIEAVLPALESKEIPINIENSGKV